MANVGEAKARFSALLRQVEAGETVVIARGGRAIAKIVPMAPLASRRSLGVDDGLGFISDDFDAPLPDDVRRSFYAARSGTGEESH